MAQRNNTTGFDPELLKSRTTLSANLDNNIIAITEDKVKLGLRDYREAILASHEWKAPLSLFFTALIALATSNFENRWFVSSNAWVIFFWSTLICSLVWLILSFKKLYTHRYKLRLDYWISELKRESKITNTDGASD